jgi:hypothetical protein
MFKQTWWVTLAVLLAGFEAFMAVGFGLDSELTVAARVGMFLLPMAFAVTAIIGARLRPRQRQRGDALIAIGLVPSALVGVVFFWFPPMWLVTVAGVAVMVATIRDARVPVPVAA